MNGMDSDSLAAHLSSPLPTDQHNVLKTLLRNELLVKNFRQSELQTLVSFIHNTKDEQSIEMVLNLFLKCDPHRLSTFDDVLVPLLLSYLKKPITEVRLYSICNLSIMSENSKQVIETLLRDPESVTLLINLIKDNSVKGEIRTHTLHLLHDITRGRELCTLLAFHDCVIALLELLCSLCTSDHSDNGYLSLKIISQLVSEKKARDHLIHSEGLISLCKLMEMKAFVNFPSKMTVQYFQIMRILLEEEEKSFLEALIREDRVESFLQLVMQSFEFPDVSHRAANYLETLMRRSQGVSLYICMSQRLDSLVTLAISSECDETRRSITTLLCRALREGHKNQSAFCSKQRSLQIIIGGIVMQSEKETYHLSALQILHDAIANNFTTKNSLAESAEVPLDEKSSFLTWIIDRLCIFAAKLGDTQPTNQSLDNTSSFHLWLFKVLLEWILDSPIVVKKAQNLPRLVSIIMTLLSSDALSPIPTFASSWFLTMGVLLVMTMYNTMHDKKWITVLSREARLSRILECCDLCLKNTNWSSEIVSKTAHPPTLPFDEIFCRRMRGMFDGVIGWICEDIMEEKIPTAESNGIPEAGILCIKPQLNQNSSALDERKLETEVEALWEQTEVLPNLSEISEDDQKSSGRIPASEYHRKSASPTISHNVYEDLQSLRKEFRQFQSTTMNELETIKSELDKQKVVNSKYESDISELRALIEAMNAFQNFE